MSEQGSAPPFVRGGRRGRGGEVGGAEATLAATDVQTTTESGPAVRKRPWYYSTTVIALAYFLFSPLGSLLILTDRRRSKKAKIRAVAVLLFSLTLLTYRIAFMPPTHF